MKIKFNSVYLWYFPTELTFSFSKKMIIPSKHNNKMNGREEFTTCIAWVIEIGVLNHTFNKQFIPTIN